MAKPEIGPACPGCTPELIDARMARFPRAFAACRPCRENGALAHAFGTQKTNRDKEDETELSRGEGSEPDGAVWQNRKWRVHVES